MIRSYGSLPDAKERINALKEKPVEVTLNLGRNKFVSFKGVLSGVYPALFTVVPFDKSFTRKTSYSYSECLYGRVNLKEYTV